MSKQLGLFGRPAEPPKDFGTEPFKLVRRDDPETSYQAAESVDTTKLEALVWSVIKEFGKNGCISDDVRGKLHHFPYSSVTARYKALAEKGYIKFTGETRQGNSGRKQRIMIAVIETAEKT